MRDTLQFVVVKMNIVKFFQCSSSVKEWNLKVEMLHETVFTLRSLLNENQFYIENYVESKRKSEMCWFRAIVLLKW